MSEDTLTNATDAPDLAPTADFAAQANGTADLYDAAAADHEGFWADQARKYITWSTPFTESLDSSNPPFAKWFADGELNASSTRWTATSRPATVTGSRSTSSASRRATPATSPTRTSTPQVQRAANALADLGVGKGDTSGDLPADDPRGCGRHARLCPSRSHRTRSSSVGSHAEALHSRIDDAEVQGRHHLRRWLPSRTPPSPSSRPSTPHSTHGDTSVEHVLVVKRTGQDTAWNDSATSGGTRRSRRPTPTHEAQAFEAEHPLFILYTSGTTGKPKGIFHTTGGYLAQAAYTNSVVHDVHPETDVYWCTADIGWVTGHSYIVYGPLTNGVTQVMYEGTPDTPGQGTLVADRAGLQGLDPLHRPDGRPHLHEVG